MKLSVLSYGSAKDVVIIGAGIAGLAAALELSHLGYRVHVFESAAGPGGKLRTVPSAAGPVDIGPTVLTMLNVFEDLFSRVGEDLNQHIKPIRQKILARHYWPDGAALDFFDNNEVTREAIQEFGGSRSVREYDRFYRDTRALFEAFEGPMMRNPTPRVMDMNMTILRQPSLALKLRPWVKLASYVTQQFSDPRLAQLFARYATYVGGSPLGAPALLSLVWQAEARGVWAIEGGLHQLARAIEAVATHRGAQFHYNTGVEDIEVIDGEARGVILDNGDYIRADIVVFNGDPLALSEGKLGPETQSAVPDIRKTPRALSAYVWGFSAQYSGPDLVHNTVFFADRPNSEFEDIAQGKMPVDPTIYVCAQDRGVNQAYPKEERFELILNAQAVPNGQSYSPPTQQEFDLCHERSFTRLAQFGATFHGARGPEALTTPMQFHHRFPHSRGSLYGQSPDAMMAAFQRPTAKTKIERLYLLGGGAHPGAGLPMATLSAQHAVAAIMADQTLR